MGQVGDNTVHDSKHAGHGEDGCQQQCPGPTLLQIGNCDERVRYLSLNLQEHCNTNAAKCKQADNRQPVGVGKLPGFVKCNQECTDRHRQRQHAKPVHGHGFFGGGFPREQSHAHHAQGTNDSHDPENRAEPKRSRQPAAGQGVHAGNATVDGGQNAHQQRILLFVGYLLPQHDQGQRNGWAANALNHAANKQHGHVWGQCRNSTAHSGDG